ncbi:IcmF-related protein, partial [Pseudomonas sp. FEN]
GQPGPGERALRRAQCPGQQGRRRAGGHRRLAGGPECALCAGQRHVRCQRRCPARRGEEPGLGRRDAGQPDAERQPPLVQGLVKSVVSSTTNSM